MIWIDNAVNALKRGESVRVWPSRHAMRGRVEYRTYTFSPDVSAVAVDVVVLCEVNEEVQLLLVKEVKDDEFLVGNNFGQNAGWIGIASIYGILVEN